MVVCDIKDYNDTAAKLENEKSNATASMAGWEQALDFMCNANNVNIITTNQQLSTYYAK